MKILIFLLSLSTTMAVADVEPLTSELARSIPEIEGFIETERRTEYICPGHYTYRTIDVKVTGRDTVLSGLLGNPVLVVVHGPGQQQQQQCQQPQSHQIWKNDEYSRLSYAATTEDLDAYFKDHVGKVTYDEMREEMHSRSWLIVDGGKAAWALHASPTWIMSQGTWDRYGMTELEVSWTKNDFCVREKFTYVYGGHDQVICAIALQRN